MKICVFRKIRKKNEIRRTTNCFDFFSIFIKHNKQLNNLFLKTSLKQL